MSTVDPVRGDGRQKGLTVLPAMGTLLLTPPALLTGRTSLTALTPALRLGAALLILTSLPGKALHTLLEALQGEEIRPPNFSFLFLFYFPLLPLSYYFPSSYFL